MVRLFDECDADYAIPDENPLGYCCACHRNVLKYRGDFGSEYRDVRIVCIDCWRPLEEAREELEELQ